MLVVTKIRVWQRQCNMLKRKLSRSQLCLPDARPQGVENLNEKEGLGFPATDRMAVWQHSLFYDSTCVPKRTFSGQMVEKVDYEQFPMNLSTDLMINHLSLNELLNWNYFVTTFKDVFRGFIIGIYGSCVCGHSPQKAWRQLWDCVKVPWNISDYKADLSGEWRKEPLCLGSGVRQLCQIWKHTKISRKNETISIRDPWSL